MKMRKLAVLSHILPPSPSGQSMMLHRILRAVPPTEYCLISREDYSHELANNDPLSLPAPYHHVPPEFQFRIPVDYGLHYRVKELSNILSQVFLRARSVIRVARKERCSAILACSGDLADIPAGYLASRRLRVPFYIYLFDDWRYQWTRRLHQWFVRHVEPFLMRRATAVIVPNEFLRDEYRRRYGIEPFVIHNPYDPLEPDSESSECSELRDQDLRIVFTGAVYHANYDAFRNLMAAISRVNRPELKLHLYTSQDPQVLKNENIHGPIVLHEHVSPSEAHRIQRSADILFLPLSFDTNFSEVINTSAPGKMGEYMATGRPILAHAPSGSFVSWYFRRYECGVIVDQPDPATLAEGIDQLLTDVDFRCEVVANARARAAEDFSIGVAQARFRSLLFPQLFT
jgi:glycosyltransferase involved in cell wall biosynthesis